MLYLILPYFDFTKFKPRLLAFPKPKFSPARIHLTLLYLFSKLQNMGKIKEIYLEIQEKYGEDVEVTEEFFEKFLQEKKESETN